MRTMIMYIIRANIHLGYDYQTTVFVKSGTRKVDSSKIYLVRDYYDSSQISVFGYELISPEFIPSL